MIEDRHTYNVFVFKVNGKTWKRLPERMRKAIEETAVEVRDFQRKLNREADGEFIRKLEAKGMQVHVPTDREMRAWHAATAPVYEEARRFLGGSWVADTIQFQKDWAPGKYKAEEQRTIESFRAISVPLDDVMRSFR